MPEKSPLSFLPPSFAGVTEQSYLCPHRDSLYISMLFYSHSHLFNSLPSSEWPLWIANPGRFLGWYFTLSGRKMPLQWQLSGPVGHLWTCTSDLEIIVVRGWIVSPPPPINMLKSQPLVSQNVTNRKLGFQRSDEVKMRPLGWALIQSDWCPTRRRKSGHRKWNRREGGRAQPLKEW